MSLLKHLALTVIAISILGCSNDPVPPLPDSVVKCSAGSNVELTLELRTDLYNALAGNTTAQIMVRKTVQGQFMSKANITEERVVELYKAYAKCINLQSNVDEYVAVLSSRARLVVSQMQSSQLADEAKEFQKLHNEHIKAINQGHWLHSHEINQRIRAHIIAATQELPDEREITFLYSEGSYDDSKDGALLAAEAFRKPSIPTKADVFMAKCRAGKFPVSYDSSDMPFAYPVDLEAVCRDAVDKVIAKSMHEEANILMDSELMSADY
ncbi:MULTISPECIES: hypothetical protein [Vibrio]|uniref:hypothetical protein n=1 Tax=Vibrio TaxID=662 RepID=UPI0020763954|nr:MULTISPECIES: hypothetical protein [Vibrio]USD35557.1 hypothetical protein J8Z27_22355 [Vibrio sp. SCSIO 43186]USD72681.1 hypothetical protein J4N41_22370 [Vibrio sp. SCSIO 43139]USD98896.1 hypothetical protein CTT30_22705 [Vibrio coralliilyticus]